MSKDFSNKTQDNSPLRIAYLTGEYPRVTDTFIQREVAALRQQGEVNETTVQTFSVRLPQLSR